MSIREPLTLANGKCGVVRSTQLADAPDLIELLSTCATESDFLNFLPGEFQLTLEEEEAFLRPRVEDERFLSVVADVDGAVVGIAGADPSPFRRYAHQVEIGMAVARPYWRQGVGGSLLGVVMDWAVRRELRKVNLRVFAENDRAIRLYRRFGFEVVGRLEADRLRADGGYGDTLLMSRFLETD